MDLVRSYQPLHTRLKSYRIRQEILFNSGSSHSWKTIGKWPVFIHAKVAHWFQCVACFKGVTTAFSVNWLGNFFAVYIVNFNAGRMSQVPFDIGTLKYTFSCAGSLENTHRISEWHFKYYECIYISLWIQFLPRTSPIWQHDWHWLQCITV